MASNFFLNTTEFLANSAALGNQVAPRIAGQSSGGFIVTWYTDDVAQDGSGNAVKAQIFAATGAKIGGEILVNSSAFDDQLEPDVTVLSNGNFVITWRTDDAAQDGSMNAIKAQIFAPTGIRIGGEFVVNSQSTLNQLEPKVAAFGAGGFVVTWMTTDNAQDGSLNAIKAQVFNASGVAIGNEFLVNSDAADEQREPAITGLSTGGFVVTWRTADGTQDGDGDAIKAQVFDASATKTGPELLINTAGAGDQGEPVVTGLSGGGFVVSWRSSDPAQDGSGSSIKAQVFDAAGAKIGGELLINSATIGHQSYPEITGLASGGFVVTWFTDDTAQDGSATAVKAQAFDANGVKDGIEVLVNTQTDQTQGLPTIAALSNGGFSVVWISSDPAQDGSGFAIKGQVFDPAVNVAPVANDTTETVAEDTTLSQSVTNDVVDPNGDAITFSVLGDVSHGTLTLQPDGSYTYTPAADYVGQDSFTYTATDPYGETTTATVTISVTAVEDAPMIAGTLTGTVTEDSILSTTGTLSATDADAGDVPSFTAQTGVAGSYGSFDLTAAGTWTYTLDNLAAQGLAGGEAVTDTFTAVATTADGESVSQSVTVTVNGSEDPLIIGGVLNLTSTEDLTVSNFTQLYPFDADDVDIATFTPQAGVRATYGTFNLAASGALTYVMDNAAVQGLAAGETATETLTAVATTADGESASQIITVTVIGTEDAPVITGQATPAHVRDEFLVNTQAHGTQALPALTSLSNGNFVIAWTTLDTSQDGNAGAVKAQLFNAAGAKAGAEFLVNTNATGSQSLATLTGLTGGGFVASWLTNDPAQDGSFDAIKAQIFDANGFKVGSEFLVNAAATGYQSYPAITGLADGRFAVTWMTTDGAQDGSGAAVKAQVFDGLGAKIGAEFLVNTQVSGVQGLPAIADLPQGGFVVSWLTQDTAQDGSGYAVKAQIFDAAGVRDGAEFLVNTSAGDNQTQPVVASLPGGGFVISWTTSDPSQDGSGQAIKAQVFAAGGAKSGAEFLVNSEAIADQAASTIARLPDGGFVISWTTYDSAQDSSNAAIKAQIFDAVGGKVGNEFLVNTEGLDKQIDPQIAALVNGDFVVTWTTFDPAQDGNSSAIKARIFDLVNSDATGVSGRVTEDGSVIATGSLIATDADDIDTPVFTAQAATDGTYGTFALTAAGDWTYALDNALTQPLDAGQTVTETFTAAATTADGESVSQTITITVNGAEDASVITGTSTGTVTEDATLTATGSLIATDVDALDTLTFTPQSATTSAYGSFALTAAGGWTYALRNSAAQGLVGGQVVTETFTAVATAPDGGIVTRNVVISVNGADDPIVVTGSVSVRGTIRDASVLTAAFVTATNDTGDVSYQWLRDGVAIKGAVDAAYMLTQADVGAQMSVAVVYTDSLGAPHAFSSAQTVAVVDDMPVGTAGQDRLSGSAGADSIAGGAGNDWIAGKAGADVLRGGAGDDVIKGGSGADRLFGNSGDDRILGGGKADVIRGGTGKDALFGGAGQDQVSGGGGKDKLFGGSGNDALYGGTKGDRLVGGGGKDALSGGNGNDKLYGGGKADRLDGGGGADALFGGAGKDKLDGGAGYDTLKGGAGADDFIFDDGDSRMSRTKRDVIADFGKGADQIDLRPMDADTQTRSDDAFVFGGTMAGAYSVWFAVDGSDCIVLGDQSGDGNADFAIKVLGVSSLSASDFLL